ncbi:polysaccharide deacetylase family protein, partial [Paraconexibacter sp.]|uniref:polysaccharide deacetylase family protein n=1 Tax=Paraconexibacter sp. TaxID=2949640 RepID=UPI0035654E4A
HVVGTPKAGTAYPDLWVTPEAFEAQIAALRRAGYVGVTLGEVWDAWKGRGRLPARPVVVSFDDGDLSQVMNAAPVLKTAGWPGVLNLAVDHLGPKGLPRWGAKRMLRDGWEIGSHTISHADLTTLGPDQLRRELAGSRARIREELGVDPRFFCYPAGRNNETVRAAVRAAGYLAATTVEPGVASRQDDPMLLPRVRVQAATDPTRLLEMARG